MQINIINPKEEIIFILYNGCSQTDFSKIKSESRKLFLLCTNEAIKKLPLSQSQSFSLIKIVEELNLEALTRVYQKIKFEYELLDKRCQVITNEPELAFLTAQFDEYLMILGEGLIQDKNHIGQNSITIHQFSSKKNLKHSLRFSLVKLSNFLPFEGHRYCCEPISYLKFIEENIGQNISTKSINCDNFQKQIIGNHEDLKKWCEINLYSEIEYEFSKIISEIKYGVSIAIKNDKAFCFVVYKYRQSLNNRSNSTEGIILKEKDSEYEKILQCTLEILQTLRHGYPSDGVLNLNFYIPEKGKPILDEITAGSPDSYISNIIDECEGIKLNEMHLLLSINDSLDIETEIPRSWTHAA